MDWKPSWMFLGVAAAGLHITWNQRHRLGRIYIHPGITCSVHHFLKQALDGDPMAQMGWSLLVASASSDSPRGSWEVWGGPTLGTSVPMSVATCHRGGCRTPPRWLLLGSSRPRTQGGVTSCHAGDLPECVAIAKPQPTRDTKTVSQAFIISHFYKENHCLSRHPIPAVHFFFFFGKNRFKSEIPPSPPPFSTQVEMAESFVFMVRFWDASGFQQQQC